VRIAAIKQFAYPHQNSIYRKFFDQDKKMVILRRYIVGVLPDASARSSAF
jgi:hypothetical protein